MEVAKLSLLPTKLYIKMPNLLLLVLSGSVVIEGYFTTCIFRKKNILLDITYILTFLTPF